jgi:hypothetical protein
MSGRFMRVKRIVIPIITFLLIVGSLTGCGGAVTESDIIEALQSNGSITMEIAAPTPYQIPQIVGEKQSTPTKWLELDQLQTYPEFRQGFDDLFDTNKITIKDPVTGTQRNGKSSVLYVNANGERDGNSTLALAFRNKVFIRDYWGNKPIQEEMRGLAELAYTDLNAGTDGNVKLSAALNAYYDLFPSYANPSAYNGMQSLSRADWFTGFYKANTPVHSFDTMFTAAEIDDFEAQIGGETAQSIYVQAMYPNSWLQESLNADNVNLPVSRIEALYSAVKYAWPRELAAADVSVTTYSDTKNGGDIAVKIGAKIVDKDSGEVIELLPGWEAAVLQHSIKNFDSGLQEELYKAVVVAKAKGLFSGNTLRWDEAMSRHEGVLTIVTLQTILNREAGYLADAKYGANEGGSIVEGWTEGVNATAGNLSGVATSGTSEAIRAESSLAADAAGDGETSLTDPYPEDAPEMQQPQPETPPASSSEAPPAAPPTPPASSTPPPATSQPSTPPASSTPSTNPGGPPPGRGGGGIVSTDPAGDETGAGIIEGHWS